MGKLMIINASPRAPISNSKEYAEIFSKYYCFETRYSTITKINHNLLCSEISGYSDILFVFPLYVDGIPVTLLNFIKAMENVFIHKKPVLSILVNCGFIEPNQNDVAVDMLRCFCKKNSYPFGSVLKIGSGEAILTTPFRIMVKSKIKKLAKSIASKKYRSLKVTMPLTKKMFVKAAASYWEKIGMKNGITKTEMAVMEIEK